MKLLVIGAGAAGLAAVYRAKQLGAETRLVHAHAGSTELYTGVVDESPWTQPARPISAGCRAFCDALGLWVLPSQMLVATNVGVVRPAAGADRRILNLAMLAGASIAVPSVERDEWDAHLLVRSLRESAWARRSGTRFELVEVPLLREGYERRIATADFALLHDQPRRRENLCKQLRKAGTPDAWLCGPWLGLEPETANLVAQQMGVPIGESTSLPGGPAGARFALARSRFLASANLDVRRARVLRLGREGRRWQAEFEGGETLHADAVVVAVGGVASGGIVLESVQNQITSASFRLSLSAPVRMVLKGQTLDGVSSEHGFDFAVHGLGMLEKIGAEPLPNQVGLRLVGDVAAGRVNTVLRAVADGIAAVDQLCQEC